jgi:hypothetical protein
MACASILTSWMGGDLPVSDRSDSVSAQRWGGVIGGETYRFPIGLIPCTSEPQLISGSANRIVSWVGGLRLRRAGRSMAF